MVIKNTSRLSGVFAFTASIAALFTAIPVHAMSLSLVGMANNTSESISPLSASVSGINVSFDGKSKWGFGGGALLGFHLAPMIGLETGALYITRKYEVDLTTTVTTTTAYSQHAIQIPLLLRLDLTRFFSLGAGGYAAIGTGDVKVGDSSSTYSEAGIKNKDYGLLFSAAFHFPLGASAALLVDGRYALDLTDVNGAADQTSPALVEKYRDIEILAGIRFNFDGERSRY